MEFNLVTVSLSWLATALVGLLTFVFVRHYMKVRSLPPGPFPYPVIGNLLELRGKNVIAQNVLMEYGKKYKGVFTFWMGPSPSVIVTSWELCREALIVKKHDFSGRVLRDLLKVFLDGGSDVIHADYGPCWEVLRKILVSAVRKYSVSEKLADLATEVVDISVESMLKEGKPVEARKYAYLMLYNIIASSAFGERYEMDDPEFVTFRTFSEETTVKVQKILPTQVLPLLAWFYKKEIDEVLADQAKFQSILDKKYHEHKKTYQKGTVRDFIDAMLFAKEEAEEEGKDSQEFLVDKNLRLVLLDFFSAGTDTTKTNLLWILLIICNKPEIQRRIQAEVDENIGSRPPKQEDKRICPYTQAVIIESLRFRPVVETTLEHKTTCDTELGGYKIPKDISCLFHIMNVQREEQLWKDPNEFKPERHLDESGQLNTNRPDGFMAFGLGRRACPGEKLALADVFLIITRLLQRVDLELENGPGSVDLVPEVMNLASLPKKFNLLVKRRQPS